MWVSEPPMGMVSQRTPSTTSTVVPDGGWSRRDIEVPLPGLYGVRGAVALQYVSRFCGGSALPQASVERREGEIAMPMNVKPVPTLDDEVNEVRLGAAEIVNQEILPNENVLYGWRSDGGGPSETQVKEAREVRAHVQNVVKKAKLWAPHLPPEFGGMGLSFMQHAYMNEVLAYSPGAASLFGVVAPNSGNQKILLKYGTQEQHDKWLIPLTEGRMQSGFSMTEPHKPAPTPAPSRPAPCSTATSGHQWPQVVHLERPRGGFLHRHVPHGGPRRPRRRQRKDDADHRAEKDAGREHHSRGARVGQGFEPLRDHLRQPCGCRSRTSSAAPAPGIRRRRIARRRPHLSLHELGGSMWRCFDLMVDRIMTAEVHGGEKLEDKQFMQGFIATPTWTSSPRLMVVDMRHEDGGGGGFAHRHLVHQGLCAERLPPGSGPRHSGAWRAGVSGDFPFAGMYEGARTLRIADGPDEVHRILIAKNVLRRYHAGESWDFGN